MGNDVICVDNNVEKLSKLEKGIIPIYEPGLVELVKSNVNEKRLTFSNNLQDAVKQSLVCFIAVGTPQGEDGLSDLVEKYNCGVVIDDVEDYAQWQNAVNRIMSDYDGYKSRVAECYKKEFDFVEKVKPLEEFLSSIYQ